MDFKPPNPPPKMKSSPPSVATSVAPPTIKARAPTVTTSSAASRTVMTEFEIKQCRGRQRCLEKLLARRTLDAEIVTLVNGIQKCYKYAIKNGKKKYCPQLRMTIKLKLRGVKVLENMIIHSIILGKKYDQLLDEELHLLTPPP